MRARFLQQMLFVTLPKTEWSRYNENDFLFDSDPLKHVQAHKKQFFACVLTICVVVCTLIQVIVQNELKTKAKFQRRSSRLGLEYKSKNNKIV